MPIFNLEQDHFVDAGHDRQNQFGVQRRQRWRQHAFRVIGANHFEFVANTGGRVLGFDFDREGNIIAADAVAVAPDGRIYFTEASHRFRPGPWGG